MADDSTDENSDDTETLETALAMVDLITLAALVKAITFTNVPLSAEESADVMLLIVKSDKGVVEPLTENNNSTEVTVP